MTDATTTNPRPARRLSLRSAERVALPVVWLVLIVAFSIALPSTFFSTGNLSSILSSNAVIAVLALGILIPLTAGDFDVSIAYNLVLSSMLVALLNVEWGWPVGLAVLFALGVGALVGYINGLFVVVFGIDSLIVTLGTGTFIGGVVLWISGSNTISGISQALVQPVIVWRPLGIPMIFFYGLLLCIAIWYVFEYTPLGRQLLMVGRGRNVARLSGIRVNRLRWGALVVSGVISAFAGVLYAGTTGGADPVSGTAFLLPAFAAAFLGSTTIIPGRFNPWGALIAVYFLATGISGLQLLGVQGFVQNLFYGGALVLAVTLSQIARRREAADGASS